MADQPDPASCHQQCIDTDGCFFFTHYAEDLTCLSFQDCVTFSNDTCSDCVSGDVDCPVQGEVPLTATGSFP